LADWGMAMVVEAKREPCGWIKRPQPPTHDELDGYLMCAAERGCHLCVDCSERALEALRRFISSCDSDARPDTGTASGDSPSVTLPR